MSIEKENIEQLIQTQYGTMPNIDVDTIDRIAGKATATNNNRSMHFLREFAVAACLILSICGGAFAGQIQQQNLTIDTNETAVFSEVENVLFTHNIKELGYNT